ncbi:11785_t:CDS:1, partial [Cetraspora pellucida]
PFIGTSSKNLKQSNHALQQSTFISKHYNNIQEVQVHQYLQKKTQYGQLIRHFKKALNYSLKDNDQSDLDNIILAYIFKKEAKLNAAVQLERGNILSENMDLDNMLKLPDRHVYNINDIKDPIKYQGKGRPAGNRIKAYNENEKANSSVSKRGNASKNLENTVGNDNTSEHKCRLCSKTGHYAPKCPTKES